jgi:hypothetical protein
LFLLSACGSSPSTTPPDLTGAPPGDLSGVIPDFAGADLFGADLTGVSPGDLATPYPAGPYGNTVGDTFPQLVWEGYQDPAGDAIATTKPFGPYSADDMRRSGKQYALVHLSEFF